MKIAAFDPGNRTGFTLIETGPDFGLTPRDRVHFDIIEQGVWTVKEVSENLRSVIHYADVVAYETWRLFEKHAQDFIGSEMTPSQVVGMVRYEAWQQGRRLRSQEPNIKKRSVELMPEWLLARMDLSTEQHDQDAIMHAFWCALKLKEEGRL